MERKEMPKIDVKKYIGVKTTIESAEVISNQYGMAIKVKSYPIDKLEGDKELRASLLLNLSKGEDDKPYIGIDSKADKFMVSHKVDMESIPDELVVGMTILELIDIPVTVQLNVKTNFLDLI